MGNVCWTALSRGLLRGRRFFATVALLGLAAFLPNYAQALVGGPDRRRY